MFPDRFMVMVKTNASKNQILEKTDAFYRIAIRAPAKDGKANAELCKFLKKKSGRDARIISGKTARKKLIALT